MRRPVALAAGVAERIATGRAALEEVAASDAPTSGSTPASATSRACASTRPTRRACRRTSCTRTPAGSTSRSRTRSCARCSCCSRTRSARASRASARSSSRRSSRLSAPTFLPRVPSRGSVGASGDLAPLAHCALGLLGEGRVRVAGREQPAAEALAAAGIEPLRLQAKEGLALLNGTHLMAALGVLALADADRLAETALVAAAISVEAVLGSHRPYDARIHEARRQPGQRAVAARLRELLAGSEIVESHANCARVQDPYSLRCVPQVLGAVRRHARPRPRRARTRARRRHRQPARVRGRAARRDLRRQLPRPAARAAARPRRDRRRRARRVLRAPHLHAALARPAGPAGVPRGRPRPRVGPHDPAVRGGVARRRARGALAPGRRPQRADERRHGGLQLDGRDRRPEAAAGARALLARARDRARLRLPGARAPPAPPLGRRRARARWRACARSSSPSRATARRRTTWSASRARCATACSSASPRGSLPRMREGGQRRPNRLAGETSPYLLQHADNPVDWYPWGAEAFARRPRAERADAPLGRLQRLPLVPRDGARVVRSTTRSPRR